MAYNFSRTGAQIDAIHTKVDGIEELADVTASAETSHATVVVGPVSATDGYVALYNGTTGKLLKNSTLNPADIQNEVDLNTAKVSNIDHPLVQTAVPVGAVFTDTVYDATNNLVDDDAVSPVTAINKLITQADVTGGGDMSKSTYDSDNSGTVDDSELVNGLTVETAVPAGAVFTDTVYNDTDIQNEVDLNTAKVSNIAYPADSLVAQDITDIGNLSGTNTGDQDLSGLATKSIATAVKSAAYTVGTDNANEAYGGVVYASSTGTITLPAIATGMSVSIIADAAVVVTIAPNGSEIIRENGVDGSTVATSGTIGEIIVLTYHSAGKWYAATSEV